MHLISTLKKTLGWASLVTATLVSILSTPALAAPVFMLSLQARKNLVEAVAKPPAAHHFNVGAPLSLVDGASGRALKPLKLTKDLIAFELPSLAAREVKATLYLCDDANTFCEKQVVTTHWPRP